MNFEKPKLEKQPEENTDEKFQKIMENESELVENLEKIRKQEEGRTPDEEREFLEGWYKEQKERESEGLIPKETMEAITEAYEEQKKRIEKNIEDRNKENKEKE